MEHATTPFCNAPQIMPGTEIIPDGRVTLLRKYFERQAEYMKPGIDAIPPLQKKADSKHLSQSFEGPVTIQEGSIVEALQVKEVASPQASQVNSFDDPVPKISFKKYGEMKCVFNPYDIQLMFIPRCTVEKTKDTVLQHCNTYFMVSKIKVEDQLHARGIVQKLKKFSSQSKFDFLSMTSFHRSPFSSSPIKLARFLAHREQNFWSIVQASLANKPYSEYEHRKVFIKALSKHNKLYDHFYSTLFSSAISKSQQKKNTSYFLDLLSSLAQLGCYSVFMTCCKLLIDLYQSHKIMFVRQKETNQFYVSFSIYNAIMDCIQSTKVQLGHLLPDIPEFRKCNPPFHHLHIDQIKLDPTFTKKEFLILLKHFESNY